MAAQQSDSLHSLLQHDGEAFPLELPVPKGSGHGQDVTNPAIIDPAPSFFDPVHF